MLLCCDLDGTFYRRGDDEGLARNLAAVKRWREAGQMFVLLTGRNLSRMESVPLNWQEIVDYLVTDNGGAIFDRFRMLQTPFACFTEDELDWIMSLLTKEMTVIYYYMDFFDTTRRLPEVVFKLRLWYHKNEALWRHKRILDGQGVKVLPCACPTEAELEGENAEGFLDVVPAQSGKENAVKAIMEKHNCSLDDVVVVGDGHNDLAMLEQFPSYAMIDAIPEAVKAAGGRTVKNVADLIMRLLE